MKTLLKTIRASIYDPSFYHSLLHKPFRSSLGYFLSLVVVLAAISAILFSFSAVPAAHSFFSTVGPKVLSYYPEGLEVTFKDGVASTNAEEPFFVKVPDELASSEEFKQQGAGLDYLLVIATQEQFNLQTFKDYRTLALLSHDTLAYRDDHGEVRIQPLDRIPNTTITKSGVASFVEKAQPLLRAIVALLPLIIFFGMLFVYASALVPLLVWALLVWGLVSLREISRRETNEEASIRAKTGTSRYTLGYVKAYQIGLHAATLGLLVDAGLLFLFPGAYIRFLSTILFVVVIWFNLLHHREGAGEGKHPKI